MKRKFIALLIMPVFFLFGCSEKSSEFEDPIETYEVIVAYVDSSMEEFCGGFVGKTVNGVPMGFIYAAGTGLPDGIEAGDALCVEYEIIDPEDLEPCAPFFVAVKITAVDQEEN